MSLIEIFSIIIIHWIADFVLQTDKQSKEKSTKFTSLLEHTLTYGLVMLITCHLLYISNKPHSTLENLLIENTS